MCGTHSTIHTLVDCTTSSVYGIDTHSKENKIMVHNIILTQGILDNALEIAKAMPPCNARNIARAIECGEEPRTKFLTHVLVTEINHELRNQ